MDRQEEIALALSACPPSVAGKAAVYVLDRAGYIKVRVFLTMWLDGPHRTPQEVNPVVRERVREMVTRALRLSRLAPNCKGLEPHAVGRLAEVHAPTLIILGENDAPDIHAIGQLIHEGVAGSHLAWIREAGHILPMEKANEFNGLVADFLRG